MSLAIAMIMQYFIYNNWVVPKGYFVHFLSYKWRARLLAGAVLGLLGGVAAVAASPLQPTYLAVGGRATPRRLRGSATAAPQALRVADPACAAGARLQAAGYPVRLADVQAQPLYLQPMLSDKVWRNRRTNLCTGKVTWAAGPLRLAYTFDDLASTYTPYIPPSDPSMPRFAPMTPVLRAAAVKLLRQFETVAAVQFVELVGAEAGEANFAFRIDNTAQLDIGGYFSGILNGTRGVVALLGRFLSPEYGTVYRNGLQHELMHAMSFTHTDGSSLSGLSLPQAGWPNTARSTVLAPPGCHTGNEGIGPLDMALLVSTYGPAAQRPVDTVHQIGLSHRPEGLIDTQGHNVLEVVGHRVCSVSLVDDGSSATVIGDADVLLAPGSVVDTADISATRGGLLVGNRRNNTFIGSSFDDVFDPGQGDNRVTTGEGDDVVLVRPGVGRLTVTDFSVGRDVLGITFTGPSPQVTSADSGSAIRRLTFADAKQVDLQLTPGSVWDLDQALRPLTNFNFPKPCSDVAAFLADLQLDLVLQTPAAPVSPSNGLLVVDGAPAQHGATLPQLVLMGLAAGALL